MVGFPGCNFHSVPRFIDLGVYFQTSNADKCNMEANASSRLTRKLGNTFSYQDRNSEAYCCSDKGCSFNIGRSSKWKATVLLFIVSLCLLPRVSWNFEPPEMKASFSQIKVSVSRSRIHLECFGQRTVWSLSTGTRDAIGPDLNFQADLKIDSTWKSEPRGQGDGPDSRAIQYIQVAVTVDLRGERQTAKDAWKLISGDEGTKPSGMNRFARKPRVDYFEAGYYFHRARFGTHANKHWRVQANFSEVWIRISAGELALRLRPSMTVQESSSERTPV
jgi:hypothetical protein